MPDETPSSTSADSTPADTSTSADTDTQVDTASTQEQQPGAEPTAGQQQPSDTAKQQPQPQNLEQLIKSFLQKLIKNLDKKKKDTPKPAHSGGGGGGGQMDLITMRGGGSSSPSPSPSSTNDKKKDKKDEDKSLEDLAKKLEEMIEAHIRQQYQSSDTILSGDEQKSLGTFANFLNKISTTDDNNKLDIKNLTDPKDIKETKDAMGNFTQTEFFKNASDLDNDSKDPSLKQDADNLNNQLNTLAEENPTSNMVCAPSSSSGEL